MTNWRTVDESDRLDSWQNLAIGNRLMDKNGEIMTSITFCRLTAHMYIPEMLVQWFQIILIFLYVCQSGSWYTSLMKSDNFSKIFCSRWDIFLNVQHLFKTILIVHTPVKNNFDFLTWNSNISILPGWNLLHLYTIFLLVGHLLRPLVLFL